jgi:hypothetical protein
MFKVLKELKMKKRVVVKGSAPTSLRRWPRESATPNPYVGCQVWLARV